VHIHVYGIVDNILPSRINFPSKFLAGRAVVPDTTTTIALKRLET